MKPNAIFGNVGRGSVVDQDALIEALQRGDIAGAVLDVFTAEPLPNDNPLWTMENVILAPHTAALSNLENARVVELFRDNLRRRVWVSRCEASSTHRVLLSVEATNLARADSDHTLSRIESFSDIVIGFSLAQTALNLFIPPHPADFITRPIGIIGFTFTFAVIATFWWTHSAIFRHFFVINRMMVFFNFVALALIVLQVFALQMWLHFGASTTDDVEAARIYFGIFALTQVTLRCSRAWACATAGTSCARSLQQAGMRRTIQVAFRAAGILIGVLAPSPPER